MPLPLPPAVHGPITPATPEVRVTGVVPDAEVRIVATKRGKQTILGTATAQGPGTLWVSLSTRPSVGQSVAAAQATAEGDSGLSAGTVAVVETPLPLPTPGIASALNTCMAGLYLDGLVPGAKAVVTLGSAALADAKLTRTFQYVALDPAAAIPAGATVEVRQLLQERGVVRKSAALRSLPVAALGMERLDPPLPVPPLEGCSTSLIVGAAVPGALVRIENDGRSQTWPALAESFGIAGVFALRAGTLFVRQEMPRCQLSSIDGRHAVGAPTPPPAPAVDHPVCAGARSFTAHGLVPGALLALARVVTEPGGVKAAGAERIAGIGAQTQTFDLPADWPLTDPLGPVSFAARQVLCGVTGGSVEFGLAAAGGPHSPPTLREPVYACARAVRVAGAHPGAFVQAFDASSMVPLSDRVQAAAPDFLLRLWFPAADRRSIVLRQSGCNADGESAPAAKVRRPPSPLPIPAVGAPIRPGASAVRLGGVLPGARVAVLVDGVVRSQAECWEDSPTVGIPGTPLKEHQKLFAVQALCDRSSSLDGPAVTVTRGKMKLAVAPEGPIPRGVAAQIAVVATDVETGAPVLGEVFLKGQRMGATGAPFAFTPGMSEPSPVPGEVREPVGYHPAAFALALQERPWTLELVALPTAGAQLRLDGGPQLLVTEAAWTLVPDWDPSLARTVVAKQPDPKTGDPPYEWFHPTTQLTAPAKGGKVAIALALKCHATQGGFVGGQPVAPGIAVPASADAVTVAYSGQGLTSVKWRVKPGVYQDAYGTHVTVHAAKDSVT